MTADGQKTNRKSLIDIKNLEVLFTDKRAAHGGTAAHIRAVAGVSFRIESGDSIGIVGESGSGKSTIARVLAGLLRPSGGTVLLGGHEVDFENPRSLQRAVQMVFQDPASSLNPRIRIGTQVVEPIRGHLRERSKAALRKAAAELLDLVGLQPEDAQRYPHQFSGGQRQRIALARALAVTPRLLVADEPVASLDVAAQAEIATLLLRLHKDKNLALLLISHDLAGVGALVNRVLVIYLGRIIEEGPADRVLKRPSHPYTRALLDAAPRLDRDGSERVILAGDPPSPYNPPPGCVFHTRCPLAFERCSREIPRYFEFAPGHRAACLLHHNPE